MLTRWSRLTLSWASKAYRRDSQELAHSTDLRAWHRCLHPKSGQAQLALFGLGRRWGETFEPFFSVVVNDRYWTDVSIPAAAKEVSDRFDQPDASAETVHWASPGAKQADQATSDLL